MTHCPKDKEVNPHPSMLRIYNGKSKQLRVKGEAHRRRGFNYWVRGGVEKAGRGCPGGGSFSG